MDIDNSNQKMKNAETTPSAASGSAVAESDDFFTILGQGIRESALLLDMGDDAFLMRTKLGEYYEDDP